MLETRVAVLGGGEGHYFLHDVNSCVCQLPNARLEETIEVDDAAPNIKNRTTFKIGEGRQAVEPKSLAFGAILCGSRTVSMLEESAPVVVDQAGLRFFSHAMR